MIGHAQDCLVILPVDGDFNGGLAVQMGIVDEVADQLRRRRDGAELRRLAEEGRIQILLNFEGVAFLDSAGLGEIIRCYTTLRKTGGNFKLLSPNQRVSRAI